MVYAKGTLCSESEVSLKELKKGVPNKYIESDYNDNSKEKVLICIYI